MKAVVTTGNGGYDKLVYGAVPTPRPGAGEVLLQVLAAGVNNTEINTRLGWYSSTVTGGTEDLAVKPETRTEARADGGWNGATPFPLIQGTDCCGRVAEIGAGVSAALLGRRVLVRACMRRKGFQSPECVWMASDFDGAFAQFVKVPASEVFAVDCGWSDAELATIPCAYGTAENMIHRAQIAAGEHVLIAGASGGVGSAALQLALRRGAIVTAIAARSKIDQVKAIGATRVIAREDDLLAALGEESADAVIDNVAGPYFAGMMKVLKRRGRYVSSGAIAGPMVSLDWRDVYLKDLTLMGCTGWDEPVFPNLISYIERGEIRPLVAGVYPLHEIANVQRLFLEKTHVGNFVLVPPPLEAP